MKNNITEVLGHDVSWFVRSNTAMKQGLDESTIEYIENCIKDGISQGELIISYGKNNNLETTGWWHIINWRDIACELYNACPKETDRQKQAHERFNKEWTF